MFLTGVSQFLCIVYIGGTADCVVRLNIFFLSDGVMFLHNVSVLVTFLDMFINNIVLHLWQCAKKVIFVSRVWYHPTYLGEKGLTIYRTKLEYNIQDKVGVAQSV
jgi:hypothetical protein